MLDKIDMNNIIKTVTKYEIEEQCKSIESLIDLELSHCDNVITRIIKYQAILLEKRILLQQMASPIPIEDIEYMNLVECQILNKFHQLIREKIGDLEEPNEVKQ